MLHLAGSTLLPVIVQPLQRQRDMGEQEVKQEGRAGCGFRISYQSPNLNNSF